MRITRAVDGLGNSLVNNTYTYTITPDANNPAIVEGMPETVSLELTGRPESGAISALTDIDISNLEFTALGDYKYVIRESVSSDQVNFPVNNEHEYYMYVSVRNKLDANGRPTGEYIATLSSQVRDHDTGDKVEALFHNHAERSYITVKNEVSGNLANVDDYFKYKVDIYGATDGDEFTIEGQDSSVYYGGETIIPNSKIVIGQDNYIYLKHGQEVTIGKRGEENELPFGINYVLTEVDANGYVQYVDGAEGNTSQEKTVVDSSTGEENRVDFLNHKEGNILTGILLTIWPYALALGIVGGLVAAKIISKKKQKN